MTKNVSAKKAETPVAVDPAVPAKRGRGRPKGVKNKPKVRTASGAMVTTEDPLMQLPLSELRARALEVYKIPVTPEMRAQDIVEVIRRGKTKVESAFSTDTFGEQVPPGWSKIEIFKDPTPGATNIPVYFSQNGYKLTIPRGLDVLVPTKLVDGAMAGAITENRVLNKEKTRLTGQPVYEVQKMARFPFQVKIRREGADPRPVGDSSRARRFEPRQRFHDLFGFWPSKEQLMQAIKDGAVRGNIAK